MPPSIRALPLCDHQAIRVKLRYERRDLKTFCADCSKQAGQQMIGGVLMVGMGLMLAKESGLDALAWYGAQYPFEIVLTTVFTGDAAGSKLDSWQIPSPVCACSGRLTALGYSALSGSDPDPEDLIRPTGRPATASGA